MRRLVLIIFRLLPILKYNFTQQEIDSLQHVLDLQNKSQHLILDYFADTITKEQFVDKMEETLAAHGEALGDAGKQEISQQLAALR